MSTEEVFVVLFVVATAVAIGVRHFRVPYTIGLVVAGLLLGLSHVMQVPHLTKSLLFTVFLPGLLFEAAFHLDVSDFWRNRVAMASLAVPGVVATMGLTAAILTPLAVSLGVAQGLDWRYALVFAAPIAATDPIAVVGTFRSLGAPKRLSVLMEGESLLNDGTGIVFFTLSLALVAGGTVSVGSLALQFVEIVGLGGLIGIAVGYAASQVIRKVDDPMIEITMTVIAAYGAFVLAEHFHYSGVIATVAAGMFCGNYGARTGMSPSTRVAVESFWEYLTFALNSFVFLLIGLEIDTRSLIAAWPIILIAYLAITVGRGLVIGTVSLLLHRTRERFPLSWAPVLTWGGLRGALPMVLALSLPAGFAHRSLIINMTFGVVVISIMLQGLTMSPLLRWLGIVGKKGQTADYELTRGRIEVARAALAEIERMSDLKLHDPGALSDLRKEYEQRAEQAKEKIDKVHLMGEQFHNEEKTKAKRHLILVEKKQAIEAFRRDTLSRDVYERLLADLDARLLEIEAEDRSPTGHEAEESRDSSGNSAD